MAYKITGQCISCNICLSACPIGAVKMIDGRPWIDPNLCTNCVDTVYTVAQCKAGCPTCNGCVKQPTDYWEGWFATYNKLVANLTNKQDYWERWFNCYSQKSTLSNKSKCLFRKSFITRWQSPILVNPQSFRLASIGSSGLAAAMTPVFTHLKFSAYRCLLDTQNHM